LGNLKTKRLKIITAIEKKTIANKYSNKTLKATRTYYSDVSIKVSMIGFGIKYKICEDISISAVELTAIQMAMKNVSEQKAERSLMFTDALQGTG
jgi:hypothetical protein